MNNNNVFEFVEEPKKEFYLYKNKNEVTVKEWKKKHGREGNMVM